MMSDNQPYFYNPNMSSEHLEDWLDKQRLHVTYFNKLKQERAALEQRLSEIDVILDNFKHEFEGKLSFPWEPSPHLKYHQNGKK
ncbi:hypothetical protein EAE89_11270 [Photorhabdus heterorhabditis]|nr:hypothetical protein [Photorhabdus heterorhabditis]